MLRVESVLKGYAIEATDGKIGSVSDVLFDDATWKIRWLVVETGGWLGGRKVLIHPSVVGQPDDYFERIPVTLTRAQVEQSPSIMQDQPVSRQVENSMYSYYGWDPLWGGQWFAQGAMGYPLMASPLYGGTSTLERRADTAHLEDQDPHLRSISAVTGYHLRGTDGTIGHVKGFLIDDQSWVVHYLIVDTRNWWLSNDVLLAPFVVKEIDWSATEILLNVTREQVKSSPPWQPTAEIPQDYQERLHSHYSWPGYGW
jgi:hypothetical protein